MSQIVDHFGRTKQYLSTIHTSYYLKHRKPYHIQPPQPAQSEEKDNTTSTNTADEKKKKTAENLKSVLPLQYVEKFFDRVHKKLSDKLHNSTPGPLPAADKASPFGLHAGNITKKIQCNLQLQLNLH
jgi:hypothetical protein